MNQTAGNAHAGIEPRHGFLPPRYPLWRLAAHSREAWAAIPPVPSLTDLRGFPVAGRPVRLQLAWDDQCLHVHAHVDTPPAVMQPELAPDHADFWRQDHVEIRLLPDPTRDLEQTQIIVAPGPRAWDNCGWYKHANYLDLSGKLSERGWSFRLSLPWAGLAVTPRDGVELRGLIAHVTWPGVAPDIAVSTPVNLGFSQAEHFGCFVVREAEPGVLKLTAIAAEAVAVEVSGPAAAPGRLLLTRESGGQACTAQLARRLMPGEHRLPIDAGRAHPAYTRLTVSLEHGRQRRELGAVTLRAPLPPATIGSGLRHPYLFLDKQELTELPALLSREPYASLAPPANAPAPEAKGANDLNDLAATVGASLTAWLTHRGNLAIEAATAAVRQALQNPKLLHRQMDLREGNAGALLAIAYDLLQPQFDDAENRDWQELLGRFLKLHLTTARQAHWNCTAIPNANPVCNGAGGLLALALWEELPEFAAPALQFARTLVWNWLDYANGVDGSNTEGAQYWQYGGDAFLRFAVALEHVTGSDDGLLDQPAIRNWLNMVRVGLCADGAMHGVNDTVPMPVGAAIAWFCAGRFGDPLGLWYGDHAVAWSSRRADAGRPLAYRPSLLDALLFRPAAEPADSQPPLPTLLHLPQVEVAIMRSSPQMDCHWVAGLKGSRPPYTHHNQPDTGSFFVHLNGERLLIDPGYYKEAPTDHCLPLIGEQGPVKSAGWTGRLVHAREGDGWRWLAVDATGAYAGAARRVVRHLVMLGDEAIVLLDDIVADAQITAQYQCGGPTTQVGANGLLVFGQHGRLRLDLDGPDSFTALRLHPERPLDDTHWGYAFADCRLYPVTALYDADVDVPLVTVLRDASNDRLGAPLVDRYPGECIVILGDDLRLRFVQLAQGWRPDLP